MIIDERLRQIKFDEAAHRYTYMGRELYGITHAIGQFMGKVYPKDNLRVQAAAIYGTDVHHEAENWINYGEPPSSCAGQWLVNRLLEHNERINFESEVIVSDFETTASKIDIVEHINERAVRIYDIKTTSKFDREYCSIQLSIYKKFYEQNYGLNVAEMWVLGTKSKRAFRIMMQQDALLQAVLAYNER